MKNIILFLLLTAFSFSAPATLLAQETKSESKAEPASDLPPGIVKEKPASGRFVKVEQGYMVPYTATLPGTSIEFHMVPIPAGTILMGSPDSETGRGKNEGPQIEVAIEPFWMCKYEVTWAEYKHFMKLQAIFVRFQENSMRKIEDNNKIDTISAPSSLYEPSFTYEAGDEPDQPAATMSQFAAKLYTKWLSRSSGVFYRLPAEAEWEHAARAGTKTAYFFGDDPAELEKFAWFEDNSDLERHTVGELEPNPWGLYDIYGNVSEWVLDEVRKDGFAHLKDRKNLRAIESVAWPKQVYGRVSKGGTWELSASECRSASRLVDEEDWKSEDPNVPKSPWWYTTYPATGVGFRLIRPLNAPPSRDEQEKFWVDVPEMYEIAANRIEANGRGAYGIVDSKLVGDIKKLPPKKKNRRRKK